MNGTFLLRFLVATLGGLLLAGSTSADITFGSPGNQFNMAFVTIGSPGNGGGDASGIPYRAGAVGYTYQMGKYEVSEDMITKFNTSQKLQITKDTRGADKPATSVSWNEAARFVNWLNTSTGGFAAYKTSGGVNSDITKWDSVLDPLDFDINNPFRSLRTNYVLPSADEWYKAAYYDPNHGGPGVGGYWNFPTGSDTAPDGVSNGTTGAVYNGGQRNTPIGPADVTNAGGLSPFGVMGLGGNVGEWEETESDLVNDSPSLIRGIRGGSWFDKENLLSSTDRGSGSTDGGGINVGFRVVSLSSAPAPELGTLCSWSAICLCVSVYALRRRRLQAT